MSAHDHFHRQVHGWGPMDFLTELWHHASEAVIGRFLQIGTLVKPALDNYYTYVYTDFAVLYVLACLAWVIFLPAKPLPRLLNRRAYAFASFSSIFYHRHALWAALGPPLFRFPPLVAIIAYAYLIFVRIFSS